MVIVEDVTINLSDPLLLKEIDISDQGMKIDRNLYRSFRKKVYEDETIKNFVNEQNFEEAKNI